MADNPIKYSDFISPDSSISDLIKQLDELSDTYTNALKNIKGEAIKLTQILESVSNSTESGRKTTKNAAADADKLAKAQKELAFAESENAKALANLKAAQHEANTINKLLIKRGSEEINMSNMKSKSYNQLSAQYSLNKIVINSMTAEERAATEEGRAFEAETKAIYEEMKRLQEATGLNTLNVGNYEGATSKLTTVIRQNTESLAAMRLSGQRGSAEYAKLSAETGKLRDALSDATKEIKNTASDTSKLDSVLGAAGAAGGGFSVFTGAMEVFGSESEDVQKAQRTLQSTIAITTGLQAIQNAVQKQSSLMLGIGRIQTYAIAKAEAYRRLVQIKGNNATMGAVIAQKAFNMVANANPYVLLATSLITVVGALVLFANKSEKAIDSQKKLNEAQGIYISLREIEASRIKEAGNERVKQLEAQLALAQAAGKSTSEIQQIEDQLAASKKANHDQISKFYKDELDELESNKDELYKYKIELERLKSLKLGDAKKVSVGFEFIDLKGGLTEEQIDKAIEIMQGKIDNLGKKVEIGMGIKTEGFELTEDEKKKIEERKKAAIELYKSELALQRKAEDIKISLIQNSFNQQSTEIEANYNRQIIDLKYQLATDFNLTKKSRQSINEMIINLEKKKSSEITALTNSFNNQILTEERNQQDQRISLMPEGTEKEKTALEILYSRQIEDLKIRLETEKGLTISERQSLIDNILIIEQLKDKAIKEFDSKSLIDSINTQYQANQSRLELVREGSQEEIDLRIEMLQQQRTIELEENKTKSEELRQDEKLINAKYDALILKESSRLSQKRAMMLFDQQQALSSSEFDLLKKSEAKKKKFKLQQEAERLKKILELNKTAYEKLSETEVKTIENMIKRIEEEIEKIRDKDLDLYSIVGINLDNEQKEAISSSVQFAIEQVQSFLQAKVDAAQKAVDAAQKEVDAAQKREDYEKEARANGYAANITAARKQLELAKRTQAEALSDQRKAQKAQQAIESLQQASSLITATAGIWKSFAGSGPWGIALAIAGTALMWASFAAAKIKSAQITKSSSVEYGEGGMEILEGGSHASGNDISLGVTKSGKSRRAEGGEALAIFNKKSTRRYRNSLPDIIDALNKGVFESKYLKAYDTDTYFEIVKNGSDLSSLESDVSKIREQNEERIYASNNKVIRRYKNLTQFYVN